MGRTACTAPQCLYNGALYLYLYLYSPYGPYSLYRPSVSLQRCTVPYFFMFWNPTLLHVLVTVIGSIAAVHSCTDTEAAPM